MIADPQPNGEAAARRRAPALRARTARVLAMRGISIPTELVRRFFQIDGLRKSMLMAFNLFISVIPLSIFFFAFVSRFRKRISLSQVFIEQFHLHSPTSEVIRNAFPNTRNVIQIASVLGVLAFAIGGFDVASVFQRTFADAWRVPPLRGWRGPVRGAIWFVLVFATFGISQLLQQYPSRHGVIAYVITFPIVIVINFAFWIVTPRLLLDKRLDWIDLRRGALWGTFGSSALWALSLVILPGWFTWYGRGFGGIGIALALLSWTYIVSIIWVSIVVISAVMWERSAEIDEVAGLAGDGYGDPSDPSDPSDAGARHVGATAKRGHSNRR